ncbi:pyrroline-5-carboxylate reductase [Pseudactinotalea sp. Z1732]|uniref:pyrroline-5-carboxylate reductase n=1 Tax=Micrococcales TaxID=85006 RepID=UPI003C7B0389
MSCKVALIGTGVMGQAVLRSVVEHTGADQVRVHDVRTEAGRKVAQEHKVMWAETVGAAGDGAEVVIVAVKPHDVSGVLAELGPVLTDSTVVVSIAAGVSTARMAEHLPEGTVTVRVMPNTPALIGQGVSVLSPGPHATEEHLGLVRDLMAGTGFVTSVAENHQDVVTAISGSGPAYVFYLIDALAEAAVLGGLGRDLALELARRTVAGAGAMAAESADHPVVLRERVSSPGGTTMAALAELDDRAVRAAVVAAAQRAWERAGELGQG